MSKEKVIPIKPGQFEKVQDLKDERSDDYNPLEGAKFSSEISKYIGPYKSVAKAYQEITSFKRTPFKSSSSTKP